VNSVPVQTAAQTIRSDYVAVPGLCLTPDQIQRLYDLDGLMCEAVLAALVDVQFLTTTEDGRFVRRDRTAAAAGAVASRARRTLARTARLPSPVERRE
jgi:hypothetical protein